jgi:hypothetical protein
MTQPAIGLQRDWKPASELSVNPGVTTYVDVREVVTFRWQPYAPGGARPTRARGRWQRATGSGDYIRWVNCPPPLGEWSPNGDAK